MTANKEFLTEILEKVLGKQKAVVNIHNNVLGKRLIREALTDLLNASACEC